MVCKMCGGIVPPTLRGTCWDCENEAALYRAIPFRVWCGKELVETFDDEESLREWWNTLEDVTGKEWGKDSHRVELWNESLYEFEPYNMTEVDL